MSHCWLFTFFKIRDQKYWNLTEPQNQHTYQALNFVYHYSSSVYNKNVKHPEKKLTFLSLRSLKAIWSMSIQPSAQLFSSSFHYTIIFQFFSSLPPSLLSASSSLSWLCTVLVINDCLKCLPSPLRHDNCNFVTYAQQQLMPGRCCSDQWLHIVFHQ